MSEAASWQIEERERRLEERNKTIVSQMERIDLLEKEQHAMQSEEKQREHVQALEDMSRDHQAKMHELKQALELAAKQEMEEILDRANHENEEMAFRQVQA